MRFTDNGPDIPEELLNAQRANRLVVFAGAGVSKVAPSNLPDFQGFAACAERKFGIERDCSGETVDRYLGRLEKRELPIHVYAMDVFGAADSRPCKTHKLLVDLCTAGGQVRLITTNFDPHFSTVLSTAAKTPFETYFAPALPPGASFSGLAYVHGCATKSTGQLVLTDSDFGRAYLTEGWATRFLLEIFSSFTTLFYGYSLNDPIMQYFSRALPPESQRYAFSKPQDRAKWEFKGITPVICTTTTGDEFYETQAQAIGGWAEYAECGVLQHEVRLREIAEGVPPLEPTRIDYISDITKNLSLLRIFCRLTARPEWLYWFSARGLLDSLFDPVTKLTEEDKELARWFCRSFVIKNGAHGLQVVIDKHQTLNPQFWSDVLWQLCHDLREQTDQTDRTSLHYWILLLVQNEPASKASPLDLAYLLGLLPLPDELGAVVHLVEHLYAPTMFLERYFNWSRYEENKEVLPGTDLRLRGDEYELRRIWSARLKPSVKHMWRQLLPIFEVHIQTAYGLNSIFGNAGDSEDRSSWLRSAIEPHEGDKHGKPVDILIDGARDTLEHIISAHPRTGVSVISRWMQSGIPVLMRIAIYGVSLLKSWSPERKLSWLINRKLLFRHPFKHEVFRLLAGAFPISNDAAQRKLIALIKSQPIPVDDSEETQSVRYEIYNILWWLHSSAPDSSPAKDAFDESQALNPTFKPRPHPDLDHWSATAVRVQHTSPVSSETLRKMPINECTDLLIEFKGKGVLAQPDRDGLLQTFAETVAADFPWAMAVAATLAERGHWKADVWSHLIRGWRTAVQQVDTGVELIAFLKKYSAQPILVQPVSDLLGAAVDEKPGAAPYDILGLLEDLSDSVWLSIQDSDCQSHTPESDWLAEAINTPEGKLVEFWLHALSRRRREKKETWPGLPDSYSRRFKDAINGTTVKALHASSVLVSRLHFLYDVDPVWTSKTALPLLSYAHSGQHAVAAWHGFLYWGQVPPPLITQFKPLYAAVLENLWDSIEPERLREQYLTHITDIMLCEQGSLTGDRWFYSLLSNPKLTTEDRQSVARRIGHTLRDASDYYKQSLWNTRLKQYWSDRTENNPIPLSVDEAGNFLEWLPLLEPVYSDAVDMTCRTHLGEQYQTHFFWDISRSDLLDSHPNETLRVIVHVLGFSGKTTLHGTELNAIYEKLLARLGHNDVRVLLEKLKELGCR